MKDCIFCKIINKELPSKVVYEDDKILAFHDINPQAPVHVLIIPKIHISSLNEMDEKNSDVAAQITVVIPKIAKILGIEQTGYRVVVNCGKAAGQEVAHLHYHLLGGRNFSWPPG